MRQSTLQLGFAMLAAGVGTVALAADDAMGKDLGATIALQGQACGQVVDARRNADSDYTATCSNGLRYRVFLDANGRVVVKKL